MPQFKTKKLIISHRTRPMWTVVDESGEPIFSRRDASGNLVQDAWPTKRAADSVAWQCSERGVEHVRGLINLARGLK